MSLAKALADKGAWMTLPIEGDAIAAMGPTR